MSERTVAAFLLIVSVYGGVWAVVEKPSLIPLFVFLIVVSIWTVLNLWDQPEFDESE